jgi:predicted ribosomally synthesized peptide with SipW-like signal peptide
VRKILGLTVAALLVLGLVGGGTWAYFSDVETSTGNILTAGTLDLNIDGGNADVKVIKTSVSNVAPGDSGSEYVLLANVGSLIGVMDVEVSAIANEDNGEEDPEDDQATDTGLGDLGSQATIVLWLDANENGVFDSGDIELNDDGAHAWASGTNETLTMAAIDDYDLVSWADAIILDESGGTNDEVRLYVDWEVPDATDNRIMGDSASFDITFTLNQQT